MSKLQFHAFIELTQLRQDDYAVSHHFCVIVMTQVIDVLGFLNIESARETEPKIFQFYLTGLLLSGTQQHIITPQPQSSL